MTTDIKKYMWETQKHLRQNIEVKRLRVQTLEDRARRVTTVMSDMPKAESRDPHKVYDQLMQAKMEYLLAIEKQSDFQDWLMDLIEDAGLTDEEKGIIEIRYIDGLEWEKAEEKFDNHFHGSHSTVHRRHREALRKLREKEKELND